MSRSGHASANLRLTIGLPQQNISLPQTVFKKFENIGFRGMKIMRTVFIAMSSSGAEIVFLFKNQKDKASNRSVAIVFLKRRLQLG